MEYGSYAIPTKETELRQVERRRAERSQHRQKKQNDPSKIMNIYQAWTAYEAWYPWYGQQSRRIPETNRDDERFYDLWTIADHLKIQDRQKAFREVLVRQRGWGSSVRHRNQPGGSVVGCKLKGAPRLQTIFNCHGYVGCKQSAIQLDCFCIAMNLVITDMKKI